MEFLTVKNLCKVYGKGENQVTALDHVSLTVEKGEFTAIIGSSAIFATLLPMLPMPTIPHVFPSNSQKDSSKWENRLCAM